MKRPKIMRPEIEVEYIGAKGFFAALLAICRVGIKKAHINYQIATLTAQIHGVEGGTVKGKVFYIIPKYKFKRVSELSESEGDDNAESPED